MYRAEVRIELKPGVADPEGANTKKALELLGFRGLRDVASVHAFRIDLDAASPKEAQAQVEEMCKRLLVNPVIHQADIRFGSAKEAKGAKAAKPARTAKKAKAAKPKPKSGKKARSNKKR